VHNLYERKRLLEITIKVSRMKFLWTLIGGLFFFIGGLSAQDSLGCQSAKKKTFVIRKKSDTPPKKVVVAAEKETIKKMQLNKDSASTAKESNALPPLELPTIAGGEFGLMDIRPYQKDMEFYNWNYVILQYDVNVHGWATAIKVLGASSNRFANLVVGKLKRSKWNPALGQNQKPMTYSMYKQVVIVKDRLYEEDYIDNY